MYLNESFPDKIAIIHADRNVSMTYGELIDSSNQVANFFRSAGLMSGDHVVLLLQNVPEYLVVAWGALKAGLLITPLNLNIATKDIDFIIKDCGARAIVSCTSQRSIFSKLELDGMTKLLVGDGTEPGWSSHSEVTTLSRTWADEQTTVGAVRCYSSGTTGRPKGVVLLPGKKPSGNSFKDVYALSPSSVYLNPSPLFYSSAIHFSLILQGAGGTVVLIDRFTPCKVLDCIEKYGITHCQLVPTMMAQLLEVKRDVASHLQMIIHGGAPCPINVKMGMIDWFGPLIIEVYTCTEVYGATYITSEEWLRKPGSVGRALQGILHVCGEDGKELQPGNIGQVYIESGMQFRYTREEEMKKPHENGWLTVGDIGYLDADGYLFLTDRQDFMIISGGVNIYPSAVEAAMRQHPAVKDVAVFGQKHRVLGQSVKAVVVSSEPPSLKLKLELKQMVRNSVARFAVPRQIVFVDELPYENGKLNKLKLAELTSDLGGTSRGAEPQASARD